LAESYDTTLEGWGKALELRDKETEGHSRRVTKKTVQLALALGIPEDKIDHIRRGAILHDIGKMSIPDDILRKSSSLKDDERKIVEQHPLTAYHLLEDIPYLRQAIEIPYCHHERWDGTGYPRGLKGEEIPLAARIFTVIDVWDALLSDRSYSKAWPMDNVIQYIQDKSGIHFDPRIVDVFLELVRKGEM
jgi:putative nucleotidyltransferase with HDIG domain